MTMTITGKKIQFKPFGILASIDIINSVGMLFTKTTMSIDAKTLKHCKEHYGPSHVL